ncbi:MAG: ATP-binding protein [Oligoflexales bacterium]
MNGNEPELKLAQLLAATHSLHASHEVTEELERAKWKIEQLIDYLPVGFAIITESGEIYRVNNMLSSFFKTDMEGAIGSNFKELFNPDSWNIFQGKIDELFASRHEKQFIEFELSINGEHDKSGQFLWNIRPYGELHGDFKILYQILGQNITEIKSYERKLSNIFSCLPLGILAINNESKVDGPYSSFTEELLETKDIANSSIHDVLYKPCFDGMKPKETESIKTIASAIGEEETWFNSIKTLFPTQLAFNPNGKKSDTVKWLQIDYHPIIFEEKVEKILLVIENNTKAMKAKLRKEKQQEMESHASKRFVEIQTCDPILLDITMEELASFSANLNSNEPSLKNCKSICSTLHTIKGIARTASFTRLKDITHDIEGELQNKMTDMDSLKSTWIDLKVSHIHKEIAEVETLYRAIKGDDKSATLEKKIDEYSAKVQEITGRARRLLGSMLEAETHDQGLIERVKNLLLIDDPTRVELSTYEPVLSKRIFDTAKSIGKEINVNFSWNGAKLKQKDLPTFSQIALHILTNAIDHGIDDKDERDRLGKPENGTIKIVTKPLEDSSILVQISDDGRGIDSSKVANSAIKKQILTDQELANMSEDEILSLIFKPSFSTTDKVTELSGRGIGLDAVCAAILDLGGEQPVIKTAMTIGTSFTFKLYKPKK